MRKGRAVKMEKTQAFWNHLSDEMYPTWFLHSFVMNGKISGHIAALGEMQGDILCILDAPIGCGFHYRNAARRRTHPYYALQCSDLKEREIIMGGDTQLEQSARKAYARFKPQLIFLIPSPITDILNEDLFSVAARLRADGIPAVAAKSERFSLPDKDYVANLMHERGKQKVDGDNHLEIDVSGCGFNEAMCAVIDQVMENVPKKKHSVNIETISWGIEGPQVLEEIEAFLMECGIHVNCRIPNATLEGIRHAPAAELNLVTHFIKWARRMRCHFGTDYLHMGERTRYQGLEGICRFYMDIAQRLDLTDRMEPLVAAARDKALADTDDARRLLATKTCVLVCRGLQEVPKQLQLYTKGYDLSISAVCVIWTADMRRYYYVDEALEKQLEDRLRAAGALYAPAAELLINPSAADFQRVVSGCDGIVGSGDFTMEGKGVPVIPGILNTMSFSFPSYVRSVRRLAQAFNREREKKSLILNRLGISEEDPNLLSDPSHRASREMWLRLWWDYQDNGGNRKGCCE